VQDLRQRGTPWPGHCTCCRSTPRWKPRWQLSWHSMGCWPPPATPTLDLSSGMTWPSSPTSMPSSRCIWICVAAVFPLQPSLFFPLSSSFALPSCLFPLQPCLFFPPSFFPLAASFFPLCVPLLCLPSPLSKIQTNLSSKALQNALRRRS
jgi:hypothetical protein